MTNGAGALAWRQWNRGRKVGTRRANKLLQLKVVGTERVTLPAGTFDSYKVELTSAGGYKEIFWIAKDSRIPVKTYYVEVYRKGTIFTTTEMVP